MNPLLEALKKAEQSKRPAEQSEKYKHVERASTVIIAALTLTAITGIVSYLWPQFKPSATLSLANANSPTPSAPALVAPKHAGVVSPPPSSPQKAHAASQTPLSAGTIQIATTKPSIDPGLLRGYQAYMTGDLGVARESFETLLEEEDMNIDALHGLAAISLRQGQSAAAEEYYLRALEADPKDALALSGLISMMGLRDPLLSESRLKSLLAAQPGLFFLNFALGNLYAAQGRWNEAHQAYLKTVSNDPDNPDGLFNLAVSLDQLHQSKLASTYYQQALAASAIRPAGFDKEQVYARLVELQ
jgi:tetratricopeptide (TPR) repeat protein